MSNIKGHPGISSAIPLILPALTLWQPYADLPFEDAKPWETRTKPYPAKYHGKLMVIIAAKAYAPSRAVSDALHDLCMDVYGSGYNTALVRSAALGTVRLTDCRRTEDVAPTLSADELAAGDFSPGRWAWRWEEATRFAQPIPAKGSQGWQFFTLGSAAQDTAGRTVQIPGGQP